MGRSRTTCLGLWRIRDAEEKLAARKAKRAARHKKERQKTQEIISLKLFKERVHSMYLSHAASDVAFVVEGKKIPAHKFIICGESEVFQTMFNSQLKESQTSEIVVSDFSAQNIEDLLRYMYKNAFRSEMSMQDSLALISVSQKYMVQNLGFLCEEHICASFKNYTEVAMAVQALKLADEHDLHHVKYIAIRKLIELCYKQSQNIEDGAITAGNWHPEDNDGSDDEDETLDQDSAAEEEWDEGKDEDEVEEEEEEEEDNDEQPRKKIKLRHAADKQRAKKIEPDLSNDSFTAVLMSLFDLLGRDLFVQVTAVAIKFLHK